MGKRAREDADEKKPSSKRIREDSGNEEDSPDRSYNYGDVVRTAATAERRVELAAAIERNMTHAELQQFCLALKAEIINPNRKQRGTRSADRLGIFSAGKRGKSVVVSPLSNVAAGHKANEKTSVSPVELEAGQHIGEQDEDAPTFDDFLEEEERPSDLEVKGGTVESLEDMQGLMDFVVENPIFEGGNLNVERLKKVLLSLWQRIAKRPKDWLTAWSLLKIPVDYQSAAVRSFLDVVFGDPEAEAERAAGIIAELVMNKKVKMNAADEAFCHRGQLVGDSANHDTWKLFAVYLANLFPKPAGTGWGYSRVGWSWQGWFQYVGKCTASLERDMAAAICFKIMTLLQDLEGVPLASSESWADVSKIDAYVKWVSKLTKRSEDDVRDWLYSEGVDLTAPE